MTYAHIQIKPHVFADAYLKRGEILIFVDGQPVNDLTAEQIAAIKAVLETDSVTVRDVA